MIKHIWFDLEETLTIRSTEFIEAWKEIRYKTYAEATKKPLTNELRQEYENLIKIHKSNSAVFRSLGLPSDYWHRHFAKLDKTKYYKPNQKINDTLKKLKEIVNISMFTNVNKKETMRILGIVKIDPSWFSSILTGDDIKERKPALDGFNTMIEKSKLKPEEILYVGDRVDVDVKPAKKVGMKTCLVWSKSPEADYSFEKFEDILTIF
jgi:putative hydrolase of the HAD superfamily